MDYNYIRTLKDDDILIDAFIECKNTVFLTTNSGYGLSFNTSEIPIVGVKASGVKAMKLKDDYIVSVNNFSYTSDEFISIITSNGTGKRVRLSEIPISTRSRRGLVLLREVKTNPYIVLKSFITSNKSYLGIKSSTIKNIKVTELPIMDRYSTGSQISKKQLVDAFLVNELSKCDDINDNIDNNMTNDSIPKKEQISLEEIDDRLMTIDDFLN